MKVKGRRCCGGRGADGGHMVRGAAAVAEGPELQVEASLLLLLLSLLFYIIEPQSLKVSCLWIDKRPPQCFIFWTFDLFILSAFPEGLTKQRIRKRSHRSLNEMHLRCFVIRYLTY